VNSNKEIVPVRTEPWSVNKMEKMAEYRNNIVILQESRFFSFLQKIHGFDSAVALEFAQNFDGS